MDVRNFPERQERETMAIVDGSLVRDALVEMMMTMFLVFFGSGSVVSSGQLASQTGTFPDALPIALAFGMTILVLVASFAQYTGGHINPAVTFSLFLAGECALYRALAYVICQLFGAVLGSALLYGATSGLTTPAGTTSPVNAGRPPFALGINVLNPALLQGNGFLLEFMGTMLLCLVVLFTACHPGGNKQLAPISIGFAVFVAHDILVPLTSCSINPARTFGPALVALFAGQSAGWASSCWIYYIGPFSGAAAAAAVYLSLRPKQQRGGGPQHRDQEQQPEQPDDNQDKAA